MKLDFKVMVKIKKLPRKLKCYLRRISTLSGSPHAIALSFAVGTSVAIIPLFGIGIMIGLALAVAFKSLNKIALMSAFVIWNPLVVMPLLTLSYKIGDWLFEGVQVVKYDVMLLNHIFTFSRRFLVGNLMIDLALAVSSYFLVRFVIWLYRRRQKKKARIESPDGAKPGPDPKPKELDCRNYFKHDKVA